MVIIPKREMWFTYIGSRTLSVYIVHRLIRDVLKYAGLYRFIGNNIKLLAVSLLLSVIIIYLTSSDPVFNLVNRVFRLGAMPWRRSSSVQAWYIWFLYCRTGSRMYDFCLLNCRPEFLADSQFFPFRTHYCRGNSRMQDFSLLYCRPRVWSTVHNFLLGFTTARAS